MAKRLKWFILAGLVALLAASLVISFLTRDALVQLPFLRQKPVPLRSQTGGALLVNLHPWQTAELLAALAASAEESEFARQSQRLADHEVDQAFAAALREAAAQPQALNEQASALARTVARLQAVVDQDKSRVHDLTEHDPDDDLDLAKAQLELDTDQLSEAKLDLVRAGGDDSSRIQAELAAHEASLTKYDARVSSQLPPAMNTVEGGSTVADDINTWFRQRSRRTLLAEAAQQSLALATQLAILHEALVKAPSAATATPDKAARLAALAARTTRTQLLAIYDDQIESLGQLAFVYRKWAAQVATQQSMTVHSLALSVGLIALLLLGVLGLGELAMMFARRPTLDSRRRETLSTILKLSVEVTGATLILLVVFGRPSQLPTILGLATAGLTVALQDFIIAFFGWFVLMGRNGVRLGDWVEINGIAGEIVNIGLFRTALLETGNSVDKGRPTGRRTAFINSFAIRGQYFNFSTAGQWMWDEIRVSIPSGSDPWKTIELVRTLVLHETAVATQEASQEWKRVSRHSDAEPAVDIRPGPSGIDMVIRYVTHASSRFEVRNHLYHQVLGLLRPKSTSDQ